ncbi:Natural resistance-associated macrophage protein [Crateriforma conspicua]|uniref:Natural resistance-associated macrophage protein n=1 Tax=Crateriforma conspicua TaxID=2527996 RepID=A0A5C6FXJ2_9PLAN|nr:divalent metal cation transporter [Crateriforma conspicua]TWU67191.1 Natural resistance-associated macrophage protein [Crateriforma conspicua]
MNDSSSGPADSVRSHEDVLLERAADKGPLGKAAIYARLSGPGWLQGAITLGGGSLAGALYLGVIMGFNMMWLQPVAMILGVIMLSAISYVALSTGQRPFETLKKNISPVLAWAWLIATMMANIVWCLPQFSLGTAAVQQNLIPALDSGTGKVIIAVVMLIVTSTVVWFYNSGSRGIRIFELILKAMVGVVVLSFFGVVIAMSLEGVLDWGKIFAGFVPNLSYLFQPVPELADSAAQTGDFADWWTAKIAAIQKDRIITAFATAVGINMTFLLPYSMLRKGWGVKHRGLAIFDLSIGLIVPFVLATGCVVIAAASQFHGSYADVMSMVQAGDDKAKEVGDYYGFVDQRIAETGEAEKQLIAAAADPASPDHSQATEKRQELRDALPEADRKVAAMLAGRDNFALAGTLEPLVGKTVAQTLFGVGVLGMAISTIIILMLINGFAFCELIGTPDNQTMHRIGSFIPAIGVLGPFYWAKAAPALAVPTSVIGGAMLPIAYLSFLLLMNSRHALGASMPTGARRVWWNALMIFATGVATFGSIWSLSSRGTIGMVALALLGVMLLLGVVGFWRKQSDEHPVQS